MTSISAFTLADSTPGDLFTLLQHSPTPFLSVARSVLRAMSTVNIVRYFFYKGMMPQDKSRLERMVALAYQTARDRKLHPRAILIRCVQPMVPVVTHSMITNEHAVYLGLIFTTRRR